MKASGYDPGSPGTAGPVAILGMGRAGRALHAELTAAGVPLAGTWSRSPGIAEATGPVPASLLAAPIVLVAIRDDALAGFLRGLQPPPGATVLHLSGSIESSELPCPQGTRLGGWHPLQSLAQAGAATRYCVALDGHPDAMAAGRGLAAALGHPTLSIPPGGKAAYHAAAVLASNGLVALQAEATAVLQGLGWSSAQAWAALEPLVSGTLANLARLDDGDFPRAITGPAARGDAGTVARNLAALEPEPAALYRALGRRAVALAEQGGLDPAQARAVRLALEP